MVTRFPLFRLVILCLALLEWRAFGVTSSAVIPLSPKQELLLVTAKEIMDTFAVSYVYGGSKIQNEWSCDQCAACLSSKNVAKNQRLTACPQCRDCTIDCSHFLQLVFAKAQMEFPYLDTKTMLALTEEKLRKNYKLNALGSDLSNAKTGDLLVYIGHVVLLEAIYSGGRGNIIHATSGRIFKGPGEGIQRETNVDLRFFRGPLQRILRHSDLGVEPPFFQHQGASNSGLRLIPKR